MELKSLLIFIYYLEYKQKLLASVGGCFSGSSIVDTLRGQLKVSSLKLNDFVLTYTQGLGLHYNEVNFLDKLLSTDMNN